MPLPTRLVHLSILSTLLAASPAGLPAAGQAVPISLKGSQEMAPAGTIAQMKVFVTEPKPISTGHGRMDFDGFDAIDGVSLVSPADDAFGVAVVRGSTVAVAVNSPSATLATADDYPVMTVTGHVPARAANGSTFPFVIDPVTLRLFDPSGTLYPNEVNDGLLTVGAQLTVSDVRPGSADLAAGSVVSIIGTGFNQTTEVRFADKRLKSVKLVSSTRIDVVLAQRVRMHGQEVRVKNSVGPRVDYFSYQRTRRAGTSANAVLQDAVPLFPGVTVTEATVPVPRVPTGIAIQNIGGTAVSVTAELRNKSGVRKGTASLTLPANSYSVRDVFEIFSLPYSAGWTVHVTGSQPIQVMGVGIDKTGAATPILPR